MKEQEEEITPYPKTLNVKNIRNVNIWGDHWRHAYVEIEDDEFRNYRILKPTLLQLLRRDIEEAFVVSKYGRYYLEFKLPAKIKQQRKLSSTEISCDTCNGHGLIKYMTCPECNGLGKLNWVQKVFIPKRRNNNSENE